MIISSSVLTVLFEEPFWVGIYERRSCGGLQVSKVVFGSEPKDLEIYERFLSDFSSLRFTECFEDFEKAKKVVNPKRMQRIIKAQTKCKGIGTKAQNALKLQHELDKDEFHQRKKVRDREEEQRKFELRRNRRKEKHKGR